MSWKNACLRGGAILVSLVGCAGLLFAQTARLGSEFRVNSYTTSYQERPQVSRNDAGAFVVVWQSQLKDGSMRGIAARRYDASGANQGPEFDVNTYTAGDQLLPSVALDGLGEFVVVWQSEGQDGQYGGVFGQRFNSSGAPTGGEFFVNTYTTGDERSPAVAKDSSGNFVVIWEDGAGPAGLCCFRDGEGSAIYGQRFSNVGVLQGAEFLVNSYTRDYQSYPAVGRADAGNFVVAWSSYGQDRSDYGIFGQRYLSSGATSGSEFQANTFTAFSQVSSRVAVNGSGSFVVAWQGYGQDGSGYGVFAQRFSSTGTKVGSEFRANTYTVGDQKNPAVAIDNSGNFVIVWQSNLQDGSGTGVFGQRYTSAGAAKGLEFRVNSYTFGSQRFPSVDMDGSGNFVAAWESVGQDRSATGVYAQRFRFADCSALSVSGPTNQISCAGGTAFFRVTPSGWGPFTYQWRKNGVNLTDGGNISGSKKAALKIKQVSAADVASYDCIVKDYCLPAASFTTPTATLSLIPGTAPGVVSGLVVQKINNRTQLRMTWNNTTNASDYVVLQDTAPDGLFSSQAGTSLSGSAGLTLAMPTGDRYYSVAGRNAACGIGPLD